MPTVTQIQKDPNAFFGFTAPTTDEQKKQIKSLEYILQLAGLTNTNISRWDIVTLFGTGTGNALVTDKREINKRFMERLSTKISVSITVDEALEKLEAMPEVINSINQFGIRYIEGEKNKIKREIEYALENLKNSFRSVDTYTTSCVQLRQKLDSYEGKNPAETLKKELAEVFAEGSWVNPVVEAGFLYLNTKNNVTISYKNKTANVDIDVNLGQLATKINIANMNMLVIPYKNNIRSHDHFHPHVHDNGEICWGDARNQVATWISEGKIGSILKMLYSLLFNYNDGNPYVHIQDFKNNSTKYGAIRESLKHPDRKRKPEPEDKVVPAASGLPTTPTVEPVFSVGDSVEFETQDETSRSQPRWNYRTDTHGEGVWGRGIVERVHLLNISVRMENGDMWEWPRHGHDLYSPDQWSRPGWLRHART